MENCITIDTKNEGIRFDLFLGLEYNKKIIFSAPFGNGKTYFLNKFFTDNSRYQPFFIYPVHYVVSSNEDIFEYIKFDLLFHLISITDDFNQLDFSNSTLLQFYIKENIEELISIISNTSSKIQLPVNIVLQLSKLFIGFQDFSKIMKSDENLVYTYLSTYKEKIGTIYESNIITDLLTTLIDNYCMSNKKVPVLIIDDLDRLDPEHIFRIFNVFAAHSDYYQKDEIKFGFEKIILVCDIDNVRNIFCSKYGLDVDFTGYIDKFYDREIFFFNNHEMVEESIDTVLDTIQFEPEVYKVLNFKSDFVYTDIVKYILYLCVRHNILNLRSLLRFSYKKINIDAYYIEIRTNYPLTNIHAIPFIVFDFLSSIFGSDHDLKKNIQKIAYRINNQFIDHRIIDNLITTFLGLAEYKNNKLQKNGSYEFIVSEEITINYTLHDKFICLHPFSTEELSSIPNNIVSKIIVDACENYLELKSNRFTN